MSRRQLQRVFEIDRRIRNGEYPHPEALAVEMEVSRRVIFNDRQFLLDTLRAPLEYSRERGGWYYTDSSYVLPTTVITQGELLAFFMSVESAQRQVGSSLAAPLHSAIEKISRTLPDGVLVNLEQLRAHYTFAAPASATTDETTLLELHRAVSERRCVKIFYHTASRNSREWRTVEPHHLHLRGGDWYLLAHDDKRGEFRTFHLGRIERFKVLEQRFSRRADFDVNQWLRENFAAEVGARKFEVAIRFDAAQAVYVRERVFHPDQKIEELKGGELILRFRTSGLGAVKRWVLQYGASAEVLTPKSLRREVAAAARQVAELYQEYSANE